MLKSWRALLGVGGQERGIKAAKLLLLLFLLVVLPVVVFQTKFLGDARGWMFLAIPEPDEADTRVSELPDLSRLGGEGQDGRCYSRSQQLLYRKASQQLPPSAELVKAWEGYEELHRNCASGRNWVETFKDPSPAGSCRFLYYEEGYGGLGNRLLSLVSAFTYALLTQRVLVMDSRSNLARMLCEPFKESSWLLPGDFPYWEMLSIPHLGDAVEKRFINVSVLYVELLHEQSSGDRLFFCSHTQERLRQVPWISWRSNQYYVARFFSMAGFWEALTPLAPHVSLVFTHLSRRLLLPQNLIWDRIVRVYWSYLAFAKQQVGVQVRRHAASQDFDLGAHNRMVECLTSHRLLPNLTSADEGAGNLQLSLLTSKGGETVVQDGHSVVAEWFGASAANLGPTVVLVASLQSGYAQELKKSYTNSKTLDGSLVRVHQVTQDGTEWASYEQAVDAFTEMWLLSFSDFLATSSWSTFGYIAQGLGGLRPFLMNIKGDFQQDGQPACFPGQSIEPCNHFPFLDADCGDDTRTSQHLAWIQIHLKSCQDEARGIQLVE